MIPYHYRIRKEYLEQLEAWKVSLVAKLDDELASKASGMHAQVMLYCLMPCRRRNLLQKWSSGCTFMSRDKLG